MKTSKFFDTLAVQVAAGSTIKSAADAAGCSVQTAYNVSADPAFRLRVNVLRSEATSAAVGKLADAASTAVDALVSLLGPANESPIRLAAAKAVLSALGPMQDQFEIRQRLDAVERNAQLKVHHGA